MTDDGRISILIAEDDLGSGDTTCIALEKDGYVCFRAFDGQEAVDAFRQVAYDLVILDVMMPGLDGFAACEQIRKISPDVPVMFLSAKGDIVDKRIGYSTGADDYLVKPFSGEELRLRVGALLRRAGVRRTQSAGGDVIVAGDLSIELRGGVVRMQGKRLNLTPNEFRILATLAENPGDVFSKEDLIKTVWGHEYQNSNISISAYIRHLRSKIEPNPKDPQYILTIWGCGYQFRGSQ